MTRRWAFVAATIMALVMGIGAGTGYAYFTSSGSGTGAATVGSAVTVTVTAASGSADLVPGGSGAAYFTLTNPNKFGATFNTVTAASVISNNIGACPSSDILVLPAMPYTISPTVTVGANSTSATRLIASLVALSSSAPSTCQGVTFTVTLTLGGRQS